jgi:hypothetical protein
MEVTAMPFRKHAGSFTPEQLEILTAAFSAAIAELTSAGVQISHPDLAKRILDRAADGIFDVAELKRAALDGFDPKSINVRLSHSQRKRDKASLR